MERAFVQAGAASDKREEPATQEPKAKGLTLQVTPAAIAQILKLDAKRRAEGKEAFGLRIGLRGGGCDGFSYVFEWADKPADEKRDHVLAFDADDGSKVQVFVDRKSMIYLAGTTLNFVSGLMGHGFKFENPNVKGTCGCGDSVQFLTTAIRKEP
jgi:iron-sulfur cluster assembly protein